MPMAAVPQYLGQDFKDASPGMRFGMYLKLWGRNNRTQQLLWTTHDVNYRAAGRDHQERSFNDENKVEALKDAQTLTVRDKEHFATLLARQHAAFATAPSAQSLQLIAQATAPFTTGLGNEHPLENGFAFLNPYGLPYLPGSGVKGVLRQAARELASGEWGDAHGWCEDKTFPLMQGEGDKRKPVLDQRNKPVMLSLLDLLFGRETDDGDTEHLRGALTFWDVIPQIKGDHLAVEIMTPHQSHYYQNGQSPHDSGSPNPISFLTVPPGSGFTFFITCNTALLARHAPELVENEQWKIRLTVAFEHAFAWLGFGAKTAVGYGAMHRDEAAENQAEQARLAAAQLAEEERRRESLSPEDLAHEADMQVVHAFRSEFANARGRAYQPGSLFDQNRIQFMNTALAWTDPRSRRAAGALLAETMTKAWGTPGKKERKQQITAAIATLKGEA